MTEPIFTIGIPTYNRASFLKKSMAAALDQTLGGVEVVISDNASQDDTTAIVLDAGSRVRYSRNSTNLGSLANFEKVLEMAQGQYFSWLQDDDLIHRDFARRAMEAFQQSEDIVVYAAFAIQSPSTTSVYLPKLYGPPFSIDWMRGQLGILDGTLIAPFSLLINVAISPAIAFRTDVLRRSMKHNNPAYPLFTERTILSMAAAEGRIAVDPWAGAVFLSHGDQFSDRVYRGDPTAYARQWNLMAIALADFLESHQGRWEPTFRQVLNEIAVEHRVLWWKTTESQIEQWQSAPPICRRVKQILDESIPESSKVQSPPSKIGRVKSLSRDLSPPIIWRLASKLRNRTGSSA